MKIIGLGHYSRTGKDTLANYIGSIAIKEGEIKVTKISLAWKLKQICHELYGWAGLREPEFYDTKEGEDCRDIAIRAIDKTPVEIWVDFGTPAVREKVYDRTWIDYVLQTDHDCDLLVVPDIRFPNEIKAFREAGAHMIKVVREGYGPRDTVADQALVGFDGWDYVAGPTMLDLEIMARRINHWAKNEISFPKQYIGERDHLLQMEKR